MLLHTVRSDVTMSQNRVVWSWVPGALLTDRLLDRAGTYQPRCHVVSNLTPTPTVRAAMQCHTTSWVINGFEIDVGFPILFGQEGGCGRLSFTYPRVHKLRKA